MPLSYLDTRFINRVTMFKMSDDRLSGLGIVLCNNFQIYPSSYNSIFWDGLRSQKDTSWYRWVHPNLMAPAFVLYISINASSGSVGCVLDWLLTIWSTCIFDNRLNFMIDTDCRPNPLAEMLVFYSSLLGPWSLINKCDRSLFVIQELLVLEKHRLALILLVLNILHDQ